MVILNGIIGLMEYKKKFGPVEGRIEYNYRDAVALDSPEDIYLRDIFNKR